MKKKLLLIGWDAADWTVIDQLLEQGKMPALKKLLDRGVRGNLATLDPPISPMLWTTIATGMPAYVHGIHGFAEPIPDGSGLRPLYITSRKVKALWNMMNQQGLRSNVVGWWPSHPAEPINGVMVSNFFQLVTTLRPEDWVMAPGTVWPEEKAESLSPLRVHTGEITLNHLLPLVPRVGEMDWQQEKLIQSSAKLIAHASSIQAAATELMETTEWDFMAVYFDMIDHFSHLCMKFRPPQLEGVPDDKFGYFQEVVDGAYRFQDMMLERQLELAGEDTAVLILSDHGFHSGVQRPRYLPIEPAGPTFEHSPFGVFCFAGPGIKKNARIYGASLYDIAPTVLTYMGLPIGEDMPGKPLMEAFSEAPDVQKIPSWEKYQEGDSGQHTFDRQQDAEASARALQQLVELGYIEKPDENVEKAVLHSRCENKYYLARSYMFDQHYSEALLLLEEITGLRPDVKRYSLLLAQCNLQLGRLDECAALAETFRGDRETESFGYYLTARVFAARHRPHKALFWLNKAQEQSANSPELLTQAGNLYLSLSDYTKAEEIFRKLTLHDPQHIPALFGLGMCALKRGDYEEAADSFLEIVELRRFLPQVHYQLGEALIGLGEHRHAEEAYRYAVTIAPRMLKGWQRLADFYLHTQPDAQKAAECRDQINTLSRGELIVVSGFLRSGMSLMMQLLEKGEVPVSYDSSTENAEYYPNGAYLCNAVETLPGQTAWLDELQGKVVKIEAGKLLLLPSGYRYKIIFVERDWNEMLRSQQKVLGLHKAYQSKAFPSGLDSLNRRQLKEVEAWMAATPEAEIMRVRYKDMLDEPEQVLSDLEIFLQTTLNKDAALQVPDARFYNER